MLRSDKEVERKFYRRRHRDFHGYKRLEQRHTREKVFKTNEIGLDIRFNFFNKINYPKILGTNQPKKELCLVDYGLDNGNYWVATNHHNLTEVQITMICTLCCNLEICWARRKRRSNVYHPVVRNTYDFMMQQWVVSIIALLLMISCLNEFGRTVNIQTYNNLTENHRISLSF